MGTPGELVRCIAASLRIAQPTVVQYDRNLAAAGLRSKGGRGLSAARVTSKDAANLLIAIAGAPISGASVKETRKTWERYALLPAQSGFGPRSLEPGPGRFLSAQKGFPTLAHLKQGHKFVDALTTLIDSVRSGDFDEITEKKAEGRRSSAQVSFDAPFIQATILILPGNDPAISVNYRFGGIGEFSSGGDLFQRRSFGIQTLRAVAQITDYSKQRRKMR